MPVASVKSVRWSRHFLSRDESVPHSAIAVEFAIRSRGNAGFVNMVNASNAS